MSGFFANKNLQHLQTDHGDLHNLQKIATPQEERGEDPEFVLGYGPRDLGPRDFRRRDFGRDDERTIPAAGRRPGWPSRRFVVGK
jgi:hypothetical protein